VPQRLRLRRSLQANTEVGWFVAWTGCQRGSAIVAAARLSLQLWFSKNVTGVVGFMWFGSSANGALLHRGKYCQFDYPNSVVTYAAGINDKNRRAAPGLGVVLRNRPRSRPGREDRNGPRLVWLGRWGGAS
jgi:hypothetical protein